MSVDQSAGGERDSVVVTVTWDVPDDWDDAKRELRKRQVARSIARVARGWAPDARIDGEVRS